MSDEAIIALPGIETVASLPTADIARLQASVERLQDAVLRTSVENLRIAASLNERLSLIETAAGKAHPKQVAEAAAERGQMLPVSKSLSSTRSGDPPSPAPPPVAVPKTAGEIKAHIELLRSHIQKLTSQAENEALPEPYRQKARDGIAMLEKSIGRWQKVKPADPPTAKSTPAGAPGQASGDPSNPHAALTPAERGAAGEGKGGTAERDAEPDTNFLDERARLYPFKSKDAAGEWVPDRSMLIAAEKRAAAEGAGLVRDRARRLLAEHFPKVPKPPVEAPRKRRWL